MSDQAIPDLRDLIRFVILKAPDRFPADISMTLERAFVELNELLARSTSALGFEKQVQYGKLLETALKHYSSGDAKTAIASLQAIDNDMRQAGKA